MHEFCRIIDRAMGKPPFNGSVRQRQSGTCFALREARKCRYCHHVDFTLTGSMTLKPGICFRPKGRVE